MPETTAGGDPVDAAVLAAVDQHVAAARHHAALLIRAAQRLTRNGVDLRNPMRVRDFSHTEVVTAVTGATVAGCACQGAQGPAVLALLAELARVAAEATR